MAMFSITTYLNEKMKCTTLCFENDINTCILENTIRRISWTQADRTALQIGLSIPPQAKLKARSLLY